MRWALIPFWQSKPLKELQLATFNARVETITTKPFFGDPFKKRRCLMPVPGYYELQKTPSGQCSSCSGIKLCLDIIRYKVARHPLLWGGTHESLSVCHVSICLFACFSFNQPLRSGMGLCCGDRPTGLRKIRRRTKPTI
jgi:SOS response associated peptidase (SRAP)